MYTFIDILANIKGTVQQDFRPPVCSTFETAWATYHWVKIFSMMILVKFSPSY